MLSFGRAVHCVKVGKIVPDPLWLLWTKQEFVEIKVSWSRNQAGYSVLSVKGEELNDV